MKTNFWKRVASLLLALALLCAVLPQAAPAARAEDANSGSCGSKLTWRFDPETGTLTIEGSGYMDDYEDLTDVPWHPFRSAITDISLPQGLIWIGDWAFADCTELTDLTISDHVEGIGYSAFKGCTGLTELVLPNCVRDVSEDAFAYCSGLHSIVLSDHITYLLGFSNCTGLQEITIPGTVDTIGYKAFHGCTGLTKVTVMEGVEEISYSTFGDCTSLTSVSLPDSLTFICGFNGCTGLTSVSIPQNVTQIGNAAFRNCTGLTEVTIPDSVHTITGNAFQGCTGLKEVTIPESVSNVYEYAFSNCRKLRSLTFLNPLCIIDSDCLEGSGAVTVYGYTDSTAESFAAACGYAFVSLGTIDFTGHCGDDLIWTYVPNTGVLSIEGTGDMWNFWSEDETFLEIPWHAVSDQITELRLGEGMTSIGEHAFMDCPQLTSVTVPSTVTRIGDRAFAYCSNLTSAELPEGLIYCSGFAYCDKLSEVLIPSTVTVLGYKAFCSCEALTEIEIPDGVTHIYWAAFRDCCGLTEIALPDGLIEVDTEAFCRCYGLTEMTFPASVTCIGNNALEDCFSLSAVTILNPVCDIEYECLEGNSWATIYGYSGSTAESYAEENGNPFISLGTAELGGLCGDDLTWSFDPETNTLSIQGTGDMWDFGEHDEYYNEIVPAVRTPWNVFSQQLTTVILHEGVTSIGRKAFEYCWNLDLVTLPGTLTSIGPFAFMNCADLTAVTIPGSVKTVGSNAFADCYRLRSVTIQEGVQSIGVSAFCWCEELRSVSLPESVAYIGIDAFQGCLALRQLVIRNPECKVCAYQKWTTRGTWYVEYDAPETLGLPEQTVIYGIHDAEKENAEMMMETVEAQWDIILYGYRYAENYAKEFGYTFCPLGSFSDVPAGKWYEIPVAWAYANGITSGTGDGKFSPNQACTREQIVTFIWKAYGAPEAAGTDMPFTDVNLEKYYAPAVLWAYHHEPQITGGMNDTTFGVGKPCTRAQVVTFLYAAAGKPEPETTYNPFKDVKRTDYFYKAVLWAVENGITSGTTPTTFSPKQTCTRAQVVTFLYQAVG